MSHVAIRLGAHNINMGIHSEIVHKFLLWNITTEKCLIFRWWNMPEGNLSLRKFDYVANYVNDGNVRSVFFILPLVEWTWACSAKFNCQISYLIKICISIVVSLTRSLVNSEIDISWVIGDSNNNVQYLTFELVDTAWTKWRIILCLLKQLSNLI